MSITELREKIARYEAAANAVSTNKSYSIDGVSYTRQDIQAIQSELDRLYARLARVLSRCDGARVCPVRPVDYCFRRGVR